VSDYPFLHKLLQQATAPILFSTHRGRNISAYSEQLIEIA